MGSSGLGLKRAEISQVRVSLKDLPRTCGRLFLDSGAHSLYNKHAKRGNAVESQKYKWFWNYKKDRWTKAFRKEMDRFATFVKKHGDGVDHYASMDVILNPELSWKSLKYLENEHGLKPMPVVHHGTDKSWVVKYIEAGYKYIGVGGVAQDASAFSYVKWADEIYGVICPPPSYLPVIKTHGFAMTSVPLMTRYPWYSVDSSRWAKAAGYGSILVPNKPSRGSAFSFTQKPFLCCFSHRPVSTDRAGVHWDLLPEGRKNMVLEWLQLIDMPLGKVSRDRRVFGGGAANKKSRKVKEYGVYSQYHARAVANLRFFERLAASMPPWPWPFTVYVQKGLYGD